MSPSTPLAIDPEKPDSSEPSLVRPRLDSSAATCMVRCCTSTWSLSALRTADWLISGVTFSTYLVVLETWLAPHTATTEIGANTQPGTICRVATGPRQPGRAPRPRRGNGRPRSCLPYRRRSLRLSELGF